MNKCELCGRDLPEHLEDRHHMVPKMFKDRMTLIIPLHRICHQKVHSTFSEHELKDYYHLPERLKEHEEIQKFIKWVKKKPPEFYDKNDDTKARKKKRRR